MCRFLTASLLGVLVLSLGACRSFPEASSSPRTKGTAAASGVAQQEVAAAERYAPVYHPGYQAPPHGAQVQPVGYGHGADCGCGHHSGRIAPHGCREVFRFDETFPTDDPHTQWAPDGVARPWPQDEYLWDGGDRNRDVRVATDKTVYGLDLEDTVVHYDTYAGKTEVAASNRVPLYAPRFAAVRHIVSMEEQNKAERLAQADKPLEAGLQAHTDRVTHVHQPLPAIAQLGVKQVRGLRERNAGLTADHTAHLLQAHGGLEPYEQFQVIAHGNMDNSDKPRLAQMAANAITWLDNKAVQVAIDGTLAVEAVKNDKLGETILYDRQGKPQMRIVKIADRREALPGDMVKFTLRFDNIGDEKVERVVIIDNLTTRLEYVPESQQCSHEHKFITTDNTGETLTLRWELDQPLRAGEGGIIRFQCRVR